MEKNMENDTEAGVIYIYTYTHTHTHIYIYIHIRLCVVVPQNRETYYRARNMLVLVMDPTKISLFLGNSHIYVCRGVYRHRSVDLKTYNILSRSI